MNVDWKRIEELQAEIGPAAFEQVLAMFVIELDDGFRRLARLEDPRDAPATLHAMKGAALSIGLDRLARLCLELERAPVDRPALALADALKDAKAELLAGMVQR